MSIKVTLPKAGQAKVVTAEVACEGGLMMFRFGEPNVTLRENIMLGDYKP